MKPREIRRRTIVKALIWRVIGILWTFLGAYIIILVVPKKYSTALTLSALIAAYHHSTRLVMYYIYERVWLKIKWGYSDNESELTNRELVLWIIGIIVAVILLLYFLTFINPLIEPKQ